MRSCTRCRLLGYSAFCILHSALLLTSGCNVIGAFAQVTPPPDVAPAYVGLANQTVAVMVWTDRGVRIDFPELQADVAKNIDSKLREGTRPKNPKQKPSPELVNVQYLDPMAVVRFQADHPELEGTPSTELGTRLGVTRVIYIEIYTFETRSNLSVDLFKGTVLARLEVLEVARDAEGKKTAHLAYNDSNVSVTYPHQPEGIGGTDITAEEVYHQTVDEFATEIALRFVRHEGHW
jgi:hypothetical protein